MYGKFQDFLKAEIQSIKDAGLYKTERLIATPQDAEIKLTTGETVLELFVRTTIWVFLPIRE